MLKEGRGCSRGGVAVYVECYWGREVLFVVRGGEACVGFQERIKMVAIEGRGVSGA